MLATPDAISPLDAGWLTRDFAAIMLMMPDALLICRWLMSCRAV